MEPARLKQDGLRVGRVVLCHGTFDLLHLGHIRHLEEAASLGDALVVSVTADEHVNKGHGRPHFTLTERMEALRALRCVDEVIASNSPDAAEVIKEVKPAFYVKGMDYADGIDPVLRSEIEAVESVGGQFYATKAAKSASSSHLINTQRFPETTLNYLKEAKENGYRDRILRAFDEADKLKITYVGEVITDEYRYVSGLGKPSKEFILATVEQSREEFFGGVVAASNQGEFRDRTWLSGGRAIRKTRFVDNDFTRKLFEVYDTVDTDVGADSRFKRELADKIRISDCIVVFDFGHGLMDRLAIDMVQHAKFVAVNCQTNAGNVGFNPISRYQSVNLVCVDEPEARLATQKRNGSLHAVGLALQGVTKADDYVVTAGKNGCWAYAKGDSVESVIPAFSSRGLDTMGAGDAFLAVAAPLVAAGLPLGAAAFVGNVAGAIKTTIIGHRRNVRRDEIIQTVEALLA